jgi:hypothetical protein
MFNSYGSTLKISPQLNSQDPKVRPWMRLACPPTSSTLAQVGALENMAESIPLRGV